ncbi:MAG: FAD:protein FMN transferase [Mycobacteriales bacterium]
MGTVATFMVIPGPAGEDAARGALTQACAVLHRADAVFSTWKPDSPVSRLRRGEIDLASTPPEVAEVLELCRTARELSGGWFDPWALPGGVDPTGLVKGWAVEEALAVLARVGVAGAMVNGGGDIAISGEPTPGQPWRIGIRHPWLASALACVVATRTAVATSGIYERGEHVFNVRTGAWDHRLVSATVAGPRLAIADALATALVAAGTEGLALVAAVTGYTAYVVGPGGEEAHTPGFPFAPPVPEESGTDAAAGRSAG